MRYTTVFFLACKSQILRRKQGSAVGAICECANPSYEREKCPLEPNCRDSGQMEFLLTI